MRTILHAIEGDPVVREFVQDKAQAENLYRALCNNKLCNKRDPVDELSMTWRRAAMMIADLRMQDEDYLFFYCAGNEGFVHPDVERIFELIDMEVDFVPL